MIAVLHSTCAVKTLNASQLDHICVLHFVSGIDSYS